MAVATLIALARLWPERDLRPVLEGIPVALGVTALCSLPFLVNGHFGELGASVLDDISFHLAQADAMRTLSKEDAHVIAAGYPSGPHAVVATIAEGTGIGVSRAFTGLLIAIPVLTALSAFAVIPGRSRLLRWVGATIAGLPYLCAGYFAQSAFKGTLMALFLLGSALVMRDAHQSRRLNLGHVLTLGLITGGGGGHLRPRRDDLARGNRICSRSPSSPPVGERAGSAGALREPTRWPRRPLLGRACSPRGGTRLGETSSTPDPASS